MTMPTAEDVLWDVLLARDGREILFDALDHVVDHQYADTSLPSTQVFVFDAGDQAAIALIHDVRGEDPAAMARELRIKQRLAEINKETRRRKKLGPRTEEDRRVIAKVMRASRRPGFDQAFPRTLARTGTRISAEGRRALAGLLFRYRRQYQLTHDDHQYIAEHS